MIQPTPGMRADQQQIGAQLARSREQALRRCAETDLAGDAGQWYADRLGPSLDEP